MAAAAVVLPLLLLLSVVQTHGDHSARTFVDWEHGMMVYGLSGACYSTVLDSRQQPQEPQQWPETLYATQLVEDDQVLILNDLLSCDCPLGDTWWLSAEPPNLPNLADYLRSYSANQTTLKHVSAAKHRRRRSVQQRRQQPSGGLRRRLQQLSRRQPRRGPQREVRGRGHTRRGSVLLTNDPYPSPSFVRTGSNGQRFRHYKAFYDEIARMSDPPSSAQNSNRNGHVKDEPSGSNGNPEENTLNSYSLRVRDRPNAQNLQNAVLDEHNQHQKQPERKVLRKEWRDDQPLQPLRRQQLQHERQLQQKYEILENTNNDKRHIMNANIIVPTNNDPQALLQNPSRFVDENEDNQIIQIPDSIIKDGQVFYRHDTNSSPNNEADQYNLQASDDFGNIDHDVTDQSASPESEGTSLIFSQAMGSTGHEGSFKAEAEGRGQTGELTHSAVDGGASGSSSSASAIRFDQQAIAHVHVSPTSSRRSDSIDGSSHSSNMNPPSAISSSHIEEMMRRNGYTGFAMATVTARNKNGSRRPQSTLGEILPGYSSSHIIEDESNVFDTVIDDDKHGMVDSIIEQVYDPAPDSIIIDHGGLEGGAGDIHRESEFQQVHQGELQEGRLNQTRDEESVGLATYTQGIHGFPPAAEADYPELYYDIGKYNHDFNHPLYYPSEDYGSEIAAKIPQNLLENPDLLSESHLHLPIHLNTGIQYPIIEGDVPPGRNSENNHMIVDNSLSSYFPQPHHADKYNYPDQVSEIVEPNFVNYGDSRNVLLNSSLIYDSHSVKDSPESSSISTTTVPVLSIDEVSHQPVGNNVIHFPNYQRSDDIYTNNRMHDLDNGNVIEQVSSQNENLNNNHTQSLEFPSLINSQQDRVEEYLNEDGVPAQPAYNSLREYERSRQNNVNPSELESSSHNLRRDDLQEDTYESQNINNRLHSVNQYDKVSKHRSHYDFPADVEDEFDENEVEYSDNNYDSSYETSSQSSSQSNSQAVFTSSHHYSYQHGSNERGIGSSTSTAVGQPSQNIASNQHSYLPAVPDNSLARQPSESSLSSRMPVQPRPSSSIPILGFHDGRTSQPSAAEGMMAKPVLTPGRVGTSQHLNPAGPNLPDVRVVMAEAPSATDLQQRTGRVILSGEKIPGTKGYLVPPGFRGRLVLGNAGMSSMTSSNTSPGMFMQMNNHVSGQILPSKNNNGRQNMQMNLNSASSASSSGSGVSSSISSSSKVSGMGALSATSSSASNQFGNNINYNNGGHNSNSQPIFYYQQSYNNNNNNPRRNYHQPNQVADPHFPGINQKHNRNIYSRSNNNPAMRSKSWSSWKSSSWRTSGNGDMGPDVNNWNGGRNNGQYVSQSSSTPVANDCGYWSMKCEMVQSPFRQNEICRPNHVILPCCC